MSRMASKFSRPAVGHYSNGLPADIAEYRPEASELRCAATAEPSIECRGCGADLPFSTCRCPKCGGNELERFSGNATPWGTTVAPTTIM